MSNNTATTRNANYGDDTGDMMYNADNAMTMKSARQHNGNYNRMKTPLDRFDKA